ncbi:MAG: ATP-binding protein, partial [Bacteroidota bacterium]
MQFEFIETKQTWDDLRLSKRTQDQIRDIEKRWVQRTKLSKEWGLKTKSKSGYTALFHGPSGTGKTLTAALLGKSIKRSVCKVNLSKLLSNYIGETEKNLNSIFERAEANNWILFFDEADAIFGKRTTVKEAHDRYANQEVSYLLQRMEDYNG